MEMLRAFLANFGGPEPLVTKLRLLVRNSAFKISHHAACCGHPGEPGC